MEAEEATFYTSDMGKDADIVIDKWFMHKVNSIEVAKQQNSDFDKPMMLKN